MLKLTKIVAVADAGVPGGNAALRAARLAGQHRADLMLLHVVPGSASEDALRQARIRLHGLARRLGAQAGGRIACHVAQGDLLRETTRAAADADLLVLGSARQNALREFLMGSSAEQIIRLVRRPVLVVKRTADETYRRVLVPVELAAHADRSIAAALTLSPEAEVEVFHALNMRHEISLRAAEVPEPVLRRDRNRLADEARGTLSAMIRSAGGAPWRVVPAFGFGDAAALALQKEAAMAAQLVVIGKRRLSVMADFLLGSVTQRLLAKSRADVLVLPPRRGMNLARAGAVGPARALPRSG